MKLSRKHWVLIVLIFLAVITTFTVAILTQRITFSNGSITINPPGVSNFFACGDYCPGDENQYIVKVYTGVTTQEECDKKGGEFASFIGWGETFYCKVK